MPLPKSLTTVTRISKLLALAMFITLPFAGFLIGINYQKGVTETAEDIAKLSCPNSIGIGESIILNGEKISKGETFKIKSTNRCAEDIEATLVEVSRDGFILSKVETEWDENWENSWDVTNKYEIKDGGCLSPKPICMDVAYNFCFKVQETGDVPIVEYNLQEWSTLPGFRKFEL